jgi:hypothetical protein
LSHQALKLACGRADRRFQRERDQLEQVQRRRLDQVLSQACLPEGRTRPSDYEQFAQQIPLARYNDWRSRIDAMRAGESPLTRSPVVRYQPTSGSSERIKFIPYTKAFLSELDAAIGPWLSSMYRQHPKLKFGQHYWSVSWLPESQRELLKDDNLNDDSALLSVSKKILSAYTQAVPADIAFAAGADDALFATLCFMLKERHLSMISVWSPTFALQLFNHLSGWIDEACHVLATGRWQQRETALGMIKPPYAPRRAKQLKAVVAASEAHNRPLDLLQIWPNLALVSAWDTAGAAAWAKQLQARLPHAAFEGKGLWATEGVVTLPYDGQYPLAYQSHFYEFEDLRDGTIKPSWLLKQGDLVSPIISGGNGLLRYCLDDCLLVKEFFGQVPCFEFQGRRFGVDLVGEKMDPSLATQALQAVAQVAPLRPVCLLAVNTINSNTDSADSNEQVAPYYVGLFEGELIEDATQHVAQQAALATQLDQALRQSFHYELARDLGQLASPRICIVSDGWASYKALAMRAGMIEGNIKPEPLKQIEYAVLDSL